MQWKQIIILPIFIITTSSANCQMKCCVIPLAENRRPDTVTAYRFVDFNIPVDSFANARPLSNTSFKSKHFRLVWLPAKVSNVADFVQLNLRGLDVLDTLQTRFFDEEYRVYVIRDKSRVNMLIYRGIAGYQNVFFATDVRRKHISNVLKELGQYLKR